jgi:Skp family chaperone for outer membrane proteins
MSLNYQNKRLSLSNGWYLPLLAQVQSVRSYLSRRRVNNLPQNLGEIDALRIMQNSTEQLTDAYAAVRHIAKNRVLEELLKYNTEVEDLRRKLEKKLKDIQPDKSSENNQKG